MNEDPRKKELNAKLYKRIQKSKCSKKRKFVSERTAQLAGQSLKKLSVYKCKYCEYWHLTSKGLPID